MTKLKDIERAHARYVTLVKLIEAEVTRAKSNPIASRYLDIGIISSGDKPAEAQAKIDERLGELRSLIEHLGVLDVAASFELNFRQKITNSIGDARNAFANQRKKAGKASSTPALIKSLEEMEGIAAIKSVLSAGLSSEVLDSMEKIRKSRNKFAHGIILSTTPDIDAKSAMDCLLDVLDSF